MRLVQTISNALLLFCAFSLPVRAETLQQMYVQVRSSKIHASPEFWAPAVGPISYGDALTVLATQKEGGWLKVRGNGGKQGFVHISALTSRRVVLKAGSQKSPLHSGSSEVVLAGKGFNKEIEQDYAQTHALSFSPVDRVEQQRLSEFELSKFMKAGHLGGAKESL